MEAEQVQVCRVGEPHEVIRRAGRGQDRSVQVCRKEARYRWWLLKADGIRRRAGQHRGTIEGAGLRSGKALPGEDIDGVVVGVGPDAELRIVGEVRAEIELVAVIRARRVRGSRDRDALCGLGESLVELQLTDHPAVGKVIVEKNRIATIEIRGCPPAVLAESTETTPERMDRCGSELQHAVALA